MNTQAWQKRKRQQVRDEIAKIILDNMYVGGSYSSKDTEWKLKYYLVGEFESADRIMELIEKEGRQ